MVTVHFKKGQLVPIPILNTTPIAIAGGSIRRYPFSIEILDIRPARAERGQEIVENHPIQIAFRATNLNTRPVSGRISYRGKHDDTVGSGVMGVVDLKPNQPGNGVVYGIAPGAGRDAQVFLDFYEDGAFPGAENPPPNYSMYEWLDIAARYEIAIDWLQVEEARSQQQDTIIGQCSAVYGGNPLPHPTKERSPFDTPTTQVKEFGSYGDGSTIPTDFRCGPFSGVPGLAPDVVFNYIFLNSGYAGSHHGELLSVMTWLNNAGAEVASLVVPEAESVFSVVSLGFAELFKIALANCDGVVAADQIFMTSTALDQATRGTGGVSEERFYPGGVTPEGCGVNSRYRVKWTVKRLSHFGM